MTYEEAIELIKNDGIYSPEVLEALKKIRGNSMRDQLKDRAIDLIKEAWAQGYEAGVKATNVDCGVVWEERIDAIKAEAEKAKEQVYDAPQDVYEPDFYVREGIDFVLELIDKHCGGDKG